MVRPQGSFGFTLIELMIVISLVAFLALVAAPYTASWFHEADVRQTGTLLSSGYGKAKAIALRNPQGVTDEAPSASIKYENNVLLVCEGASSNANCNGTTTAVDSPVVWRYEMPDGVAIALSESTGTATYTSVNLDNTGQSIGNSGSSINLAYTATKGSKENAGNLQ